MPPADWRRFHTRPCDCDRPVLYKAVLLFSEQLCCGLHVLYIMSIVDAGVVCFNHTLNEQMFLNLLSVVVKSYYSSTSIPTFLKY